MGILEPNKLPKPPSRQENTRQKVNWLPILITFSGISIAILGTFAVVKIKPEILGLSKTTKVSSEDNKKEVEDLVKEVSKIIELPNETPVLATVTDLNKVQNQEFFAKAKTGDKVLVFVNSKKAILYRPDEKKIIEVGRVNQDQKGQVAGENISVNTPTPTVVTPEVIETSSPTPTSKGLNE